MLQPARHLVVLALLALLAGPLFGEDDDLGDRVSRLEELLKKERARGEARDDRIRELEDALKKSTEAGYGRDTQSCIRPIATFVSRSLCLEHW